MCVVGRRWRHPGFQSGVVLALAIVSETSVSVRAVRTVRTASTMTWLYMAAIGALAVSTRVSSKGQGSDKVSSTL